MIIDDLFKIFLAVAISLIIGSERKRRRKSVGARTLSLVCIGSTIISILALRYFPHDSSRILAGVITGIGFLGAGAIISEGKDVKGLTTAASIWAIAIVGLVIGVGDFMLASIASVFLFIVLEMDIIKRKRDARKKKK